MRYDILDPHKLAETYEEYKWVVWCDGDNKTCKLQENDE